MQAQANTKLKYIPLSEEKMAEALEKYPNYNNVVVPAGAYNTDAAGSLLGVNNMLIVDAGMPEETAFQITKAVYENMDEFRAENAHARQIEPERSLQLKIPLHPGAERYFTE